MRTERLTKSHVRFVAVSEDASDRWAAFAVGAILGLAGSYLLVVAFLAAFGAPA